MTRSPWRQSAVDRVVPKRYPNGTEIPPEVRREIYAYYLLEKKLLKLRQIEGMKGKKKLKEMVKKKGLKRVM